MISRPGFREHAEKMEDQWRRREATTFQADVSPTGEGTPGRRTSARTRRMLPESPGKYSGCCGHSRKPPREISARVS